MRPGSCGQSGSALAEAAILFPLLVLAIWWSAAVTDVLLLKLKAAEAARFALWESTVFRSPAQIEADVARRFSDLASPRDVGRRHTALLLFPSASDLRWRADVDMTSAEVSLGGTAQPADGGGPWSAFAGALAGALPRGVDAAFRAMKLDTHGVALVRVSVDGRQPAASPILRGGGDLEAPRSLRELSLQAPIASHRPLRLVFDAWKAWPRPAAHAPAGGGADIGTDPARTYPEVERQVSAQLERIAFPGAGRIPGFAELSGLGSRLLRSGVSRTVAGGTLPDVFSVQPMDDRGAGPGPVTILPPERAAESWVPHRCEIAGAEVDCPTRRIGDVTTAGAGASAVDEDQVLGDGADLPRYTLPYRIRSRWWKRYGGMDLTLRSPQLEPVPRELSDGNAYVQTYRCRGHFFLGSRTAQSAPPLGSCR